MACKAQDTVRLPTSFHRNEYRICFSTVSSSLQYSFLEIYSAELFHIEDDKASLQKLTNVKSIGPDDMSGTSLYNIRSSLCF